MSAALLSSAQLAAPVWKDLLLGFGVSPGFRGLSPEGAPAPFSCSTQTACILAVANAGAARRHEDAERCIQKTMFSCNAQ